MKKIFIIIFVVLMTNFICAQTFHPIPESNARWEEFFQGNSNSYSYKYLIQNEDTTIGNIIFHKLYRSQFGYNTSCIGAIGEDSSRKVFFYDNISNYKFLLYDFSLGINDTIFYPDTVIGSYGYNASYLVVSNIDSVFDGFDYRKRFNVGDIWFDGIGSINGLLAPITPLLTCYCDWDLICFYHGDTIQYCPPNIDNISTHAINDSNTIIIYPNPADDFVTIKSPSTDIEQIRLTNSLGNIKYHNLCTTKEIRINLKDFTQGIYYLTIQTKDKTLTKKIIIN